MPPGIEELNASILAAMNGDPECSRIAKAESTVQRVLNAIALHLGNNDSVLIHTDCLTILSEPYYALRLELLRGYLIEINDHNKDIHLWANNAFKAG
jgi:hypothetical protein